MAAASIIVDLLIKTGSFITDTEKARTAVNKLSKDFKQTQKMLSGFTAAISVGALTAFAANAVRAGDELQKLSDQTGISVKTLATLELSAKQSETSLDSVARAMLRFTKAIGEAQTGNKEINESLQRLGVTTKDPYQGLLQLAKALENAKDKSIVFADISKIIGKSYQELIPFLKQGSAAILEAAKASQQYAEVQAKFAPLADKFNAQLDATTQAARQVVSQFLLESGALDALGEALKFVSKNMESLVQITRYAVYFLTALYAAKVLQGLTLLANRFTAIVGAVALATAGIKGFYDEMTGRNKTPEGKLRNLQNEILKINSILATGSKQVRTPKGLENITITDAEIKAYTAQRDKLVAEVIKTQEEIKAANAPMEMPKLPDINDFIPKIADETKATWWADATKDLATFIQKVNDATRGVETQSQALQRELDAFTSLDPVMKQYLQNQVNMIKYNEDMKDIAEQAAERAKRLNSILEQTPTAQLEKQREQVRLLYEALDNGAIEFEQFTEAVNVALGRSNDIVQGTFGEMTEFAKEAARNMQDAMSGFFFDVMQGRLGNLASSFKATIDRMVANLLASQLMNFLTGSFGTTGVMGGVIGDLLAGTGFGGGRASGGPVMAGTSYLVGENGPELFTPSRSGQILSNEQTRMMGGINVVNNFHVSGQMDSRTQSQVASSAYVGLTRAARRNL